MTHQGSRRGAGPFKDEDAMSDAERMQPLSYASHPVTDSIPR